MPAALAVTWTIGWVLGVVVIAIAALLLLTIIGLGRRIIRQAADISEALDGTRANTAGLYDVTNTNLELDRIARGLARARGAGDS